jgi:hypothetical protein
MRRQAVGVQWAGVAYARGLASPESISTGSVTGPPLVGELLQCELQLPRIDASRFLTKQPLTQDVELMSQRGDLALRFRQLLLQ